MENGLYSVNDGVGLMKGFDLGHLMGAAGLAVQGPGETFLRGDGHLGGREGGEDGAEDGRISAENGTTEFFHRLNAADGGDEGDFQQTVGQVRVTRSIYGLCSSISSGTSVPISRSSATLPTRCS